MKKKFFAIVLMVLSLTMLFTTPLSAVAQSAVEEPLAGAVTPRWSNTNVCSFSFTVSDPGVAYVNAKYTANANTFVQAKLTVKIQKKTLLLFWTTVDIGLSDNEWVVYSSAVNGNLSNSFNVDDTGTYRAVFTLEMSGTDGSVDEIVERKEYKYS